jgi:regulator of nucleoside diphosphate kinase
MSTREIYITEYDLERLVSLIEKSPQTVYRKSDYLKSLQTEMARAKIVAPTKVPGDVITMNSTVLLQDMETGDEMEYTLVFPEDADMTKGKVSVLAPIGTAMLGYRVGDEFTWEVPAGTRRLLVKKIIYQPEAAGDYHL